MSRFEVETRRVRIEAPVGFVWEVLTDVEKYGEWNPFTPQARTDFVIGSPAHLLVRMGKAKMQITETVCAFEYPPPHRLAKDIRGTLALARGERATSGDRERDDVSVPQHGPIDRHACAASVYMLRRLYASRFHRCGRRIEALLGSEIRNSEIGRGPGRTAIETNVGVTDFLLWSLREIWGDRTGRTGGQ